MDLFMQAAIEQANITLAEGGYPFGAVLVRNGEIIGAGHNRSVQTNDPTSHGEMEAIRAAGTQESYTNTVMYTTALPCLMCAGTIARFQIPKVVYGASLPGAGTQEFMRSHGVEVVGLDIEACREFLEIFREMQEKRDQS